jgi:REP element-mobilizing transposase RayT
MPRRHSILQSDFPYHIGARCINRDWFCLPMSEVWEIMSEQLAFIHHAYGVKIHAFVLMNNHFHLIISTPNSNLSEAIGWFMRESSRTLTRAGNRINQTYGGRHFRSILTSHHYFLNAYKYLYHNPIQAGICENALDYPFSTLPGLLGRRRLLIPVVEDLTLFSDVDGTLQWINKKPTDENWNAVKYAGRKREFKFAKINGRPHPLENDML